jgi:hypothetical protein
MKIRSERIARSSLRGEPANQSTVFSQHLGDSPQLDAASFNQKQKEVPPLKSPLDGVFW